MMEDLKQELILTEAFQIPVKTSRPMLSGVDLFHHSYMLVQNHFHASPSDLRMEFRQPLFTLPKVILSSTPNARFNAPSILRFAIESRLYVLQLLEGTVPPQERYEFLDDALMANVRLEADQALFRGRSPVSPIQLVATASKALLISYFDSPPELTLCQIELRSYETDAATIDLRVEAQHKKPSPYNRTTVHFHGKPAGHLHWMIKETE